MINIISQNSLQKKDRETNKWILKLHINIQTNNLNLHFFHLIIFLLILSNDIKYKKKKVVIKGYEGYSRCQT